MYMGVSGNLLDSLYNSNIGIPYALSDWISQCVASYNYNETACIFASKSMNTSNPANDIQYRINKITSAISISEIPDNLFFGGYFSNLIEYTENLRDWLSQAELWTDLAQTLLTMEDIFDGNLHPMTAMVPPVNIGGGSNEPQPVNENLTLASYEAWGSPPNVDNGQIGVGMVCMDANYQGILTEMEHVKYFERQVSEDPLIAIPYLQKAALCLTWPNVTPYNLEHYRSPFPSSIRNKIVMISMPMNPKWSYEGAFSTYEYVGSQNAVWLIHDALGYGFADDPNICTFNAISQFFLTGKPLSTWSNW
jgi:hypothetical protein